MYESEQEKLNGAIHLRHASRTCPNPLVTQIPYPRMWIRVVKWMCIFSAAAMILTIYLIAEGVIY